MTKVKICGIKTVESALAAIETGTDFIGLVFAESPRQVTLTQARKIEETVLEFGRPTEAVGVFVNMPSAFVNSAAEFCSLDRVQLSGDETPEYCKEIKKPIIHTIRISRLEEPERVCRDMREWVNVLEGKDIIFLLDSYSKEKYGGTGNLMNMDTAAIIAEKFPVILAGGLNPKNVGEAIKQIKPWGVDVSSGVETEGEKDKDKIKIFLGAVREADNKEEVKNLY